MTACGSNVHCERHQPDFRTSGIAHNLYKSILGQHNRKMLEDGSFEQIVLVRTAYWSWFKPEADDPQIWRASKEQSGGDPLLI